LLPRPPTSTLFPYSRSSDLTVTLTAWSSPLAVPTSPSSVGVESLVGVCTEFIVTTGGVVSTVNVRGVLLPVLPVVSLWLACAVRSEEHTSELQSRGQLVCRL